MCSSEIPAQVLRRAAVGVEFMARVVTSAIVSQQMELISNEGSMIRREVYRCE